MSLAQELLFQLKRIRAYEEEIAQRYSEQKMRCPTHLSVGQEATPAALSQVLTKEDLAVSTHRGHAHYLGKGGSGKKMIAEIYGKATGCANGRGGSMHLIDLDCGFKGSTAIVGNTIPVGVGLALSQQLSGSKDLTCIFVGDAAVEEGVFYESANFAALKKLPVLFVCENNMYSVYSHLRVRQPQGRKISEMVNAMGIPMYEADGNCVMNSYEVLHQAAENIRQGQGPQFVELSTYRWREHCGPNYDNHIGYRTEQEFEEWKAKDPIPRQVDYVLKESLLTEEQIEKMDDDIRSEVTAAFDFAEQSPFPDPNTAFDYVYSEEHK